MLNDTTTHQIAARWCAALLMFGTLAPPSGGAESKVLTIEIGQPSIWSMGQAHYLLTQTHQNNRGLSTRTPSVNDLDPNRPNAARLEVIRTLLGIEAQFDQSLGKLNEIALQQFHGDEMKQQQARTSLDARRAERSQLDAEILDIEQRLAALKVENTLADSARAAGAKPSDQDRDRKVEIAVLEVQLAAKKAQASRLDAEIASLETAASTNPAAPTFANAPVGSTAGALPTSPALTKFMDKFMDEAFTPSLGASTSLDNFVSMQYEIIAKQLTLLRDEVGPDERIVFLELPTSIYSADKKANGYLARVEWTVTKYLDVEAIRQHGRSSELLSGLGALTEPMALRAFGLPERKVSTGESRPHSLNQPDPEEKEPHETLVLPDFLPEEVVDETNPEWAMAVADRAGDRAADDEQLPPVTLAMVERLAPLMESSAGQPDTSAQPLRVRALEIIPRQSALNINQHHATINNFSLLGVLKLISGFGAKVDYQRQKEMYEKYLQQHAFASGFGKGRNSFGWTFGPLPGSKRVEPGQRTTYAVLAIPRETVALELKAVGRALRRRQLPADASELSPQTFLVLVPGEATERFFVDSIAYTPVVKGKRVTALLKGRSFSPQLGILVNGVPLTKVLSISGVGVPASPTTPGSTAIQGEFEIMNSREIVLSFSMGADYVGTPIITLVTPERSTNINSFQIKINYRRESARLSRHSTLEPMFMEPFAVDTKLESFADAALGPNLALARVRGSGLRPDATITINGKVLPRASSLGSGLATGKPFAVQESTRSYVVAFENDPPAPAWAVHYKQRTRQSFEEQSFKQRVAPSFDYKLRHYRRATPSEVDLTFSIPETLANPAKDLVIVLDDPRQSGPGNASGGCLTPMQDDDGGFRVKCRVPSAGRIERDFITVRVDTWATDMDGVRQPKPKRRFVDITLPVRPRVTSVRNLRTQKAWGFASEEATVLFQGENLQAVTNVFFGDREARLVSSGDPETLVVSVPKAEVAKGQESLVPVMLRTGADAVSGGGYTYVGEPLPIVVERRSRRTHSE